MLLLSLFSCSVELVSLWGERAGVNPMGVIPLPDAEKKRTRTSRWRRFIRDVLLRPTTWKAATAALDFGLKLYRVGAKLWEAFG